MIQMRVAALGASILWSFAPLPAYAQNNDVLTAQQLNFLNGIWIHEGDSSCSNAGYLVQIHDDKTIHTYKGNINLAYIEKIISYNSPIFSTITVPTNGPPGSSFKSLQSGKITNYQIVASDEILVDLVSENIKYTMIKCPNTDLDGEVLIKRAALGLNQAKPVISNQLPTQATPSDVKAPRLLSPELPTPPQINQTTPIELTKPQDNGPTIVAPDDKSGDSVFTIGLVVVAGIVCVLGIMSLVSWFKRDIMNQCPSCKQHGVLLKTGDKLINKRRVARVETGTRNGSPYRETKHTTTEYWIASYECTNCSHAYDYEHTTSYPS